MDDLLDISRFSQGKIALQKERLDLVLVACHAVEAVQSLAESRGLELETTLPPEPLYVLGDPVRITQVLGNLLHNACKFTDRGGRIRLTLAEEAGQAVVRVQDTGVGISADQLTRIFELFAQVDTSPTRVCGGLGLGLTVVKNLLELHDGTVEARSAGLGRGSEFVVRLPLLEIA